MGLILLSIERMLKLQFSMARKFTLQPLHRYDVKPPEKTAQAEYYVWRNMSAENLSTQAGLDPGPSGSPIWYSTNAPHLHLISELNCGSMYILFVKFHH